MLALPTEGYLAEQVEVVNPEALHISREAVRYALALAGEDFFRTQYARLRETTRVYEYGAAAIAARALKASCMDYLTELARPEDMRVLEQAYAEAGHMSDELAALAAMVHSGQPQAEAAMQRFYARWRHEPLVLDQWFAIQATAPLDDVLDHVRSLLQHPDFSLGNPNRVRALLGQFANNNPAQFHRADGQGYALLSEQVRALDLMNPQIASRLLGVFNTWPRLEAGRKAHVRKELQAIKNSGQASPDVFENVERLLRAS